MVREKAETCRDSDEEQINWPCFLLYAARQNYWCLILRKRINGISWIDDCRMMKVQAAVLTVYGFEIRVVHCSYCVLPESEPQTALSLLSFPHIVPFSAHALLVTPFSHSLMPRLLRDILRPSLHIPLCCCRFSRKEMLRWEWIMDSYLKFLQLTVISGILWSEQDAATLLRTSRLFMPGCNTVSEHRNPGSLFPLSVHCIYFCAAKKSAPLSWHHDMHFCNCGQR